MRLKRQLPDEVDVKGTLRTFDEKERTRLKKCIERVVAGVAASYGVDMGLEWRAGCPVLYNAPALSSEVANAAAEFLGGSHVILEERPCIGSEDFSYYGEKLPILQFHLGTGSDMPGGRLGVHNSSITFDEHAIEVGAGVIAWYLLSQ